VVFVCIDVFLAVREIKRTYVSVVMRKVVNDEKNEENQHMEICDESRRDPQSNAFENASRYLRTIRNGKIGEKK
jgi:hypothetical protein